MHRRTISAAIVSACAVFTSASAAETASASKLTFPQLRAATYEEVRAHQALGRVVTAPDGSFFLYEWSRPYDWAPDVDWLAPAAARRMQTWIYKVDTTLPGTTSHYLFHPGAGSSYYLGDLSPDGQRVAFYELDHDNNELNAGVVTFDDRITASITWFEPASDGKRLDKPAVWVSNDELVYPVKSGGLVRAKVPERGAAQVAHAMDRNRPVKAEPCADCKAHMLEESAAEKAKAQQALLTSQSRKAEKFAEIPQHAKVLVRSPAGDLCVYAIDTPDVLALLFKKGERIHTVFDNKRKPRAVAQK